MKLHSSSIKSLLLTTILLTSFLYSSGIAQTSALHVGVAEVNITPPIGLPMGGFGARKGVSEGVRDSLYAKILVLSGKTEKVALVDMDLIGLFDSAKMDSIRKVVKISKGINQVFFTTIHTHSGPALAGGGPSSENIKTWLESAVGNTIRGIEKADDNLAEALVGAGFGKSGISHNRRFVAPDGKVKMLWSGPVNFPTYPLDPTVGVIRFDNAKGQPIAVLVNFACHATVLGSDNLQYSADFPGAATKWVKEHIPGNPVCFYIQGASGDINPATNSVPIAQNGVKIKDDVGQTLGKEVVRVSEDIKTHAVPNAGIKSVIKDINLKIRWDLDQVAEVLGKKYGKDAVPVIRKQLQEQSNINVPLSLMVLENEFAICGFPGEFFTEFQIDLRNQFTGLPLFFAGYTNGDCGYFPTIRAAVEGGYGADAATTVEVGAGERMVREAVVELYYLTGKLSHQREGKKGE